ncbi:MAG: N-acetyltransferase [Proteobacteria bacterium]|nr:N-acetyltransferase [Pseudomonadota bacterium]
MNFRIVRERRQDAALIEPLLDRTFGFDRHRKTVYRLRQGVAPVDRLRFVALAGDGGLLGSLRFWPVRIGTARALLLGPLAVEPALQGAGIGRALVGHGLARAKRAGARLCVVVGEPAYYAPFGFRNAGALGLILPGPVEPERFQVLEIVPGALAGVSGLIGKAEEDGAPGRGLRSGSAA